MSNIHIINIATTIPNWIELGCNTYLKRIPKHINIIQTQIATKKKHKPERNLLTIKTESDKLISSVKNKQLSILLDETGTQWTSHQFADQLNHWLSQQAPISFLIGGPDGTSAECKQQIPYIWSLGKLTYPHALVKLMLIEQLYRAFTIIQNHPYHK